jgi:DNA-binding XRE family transcriptional regulator
MDVSDYKVITTNTVSSKNGTVRMDITNTIDIDWHNIGPALKAIRKAKGIDAKLIAQHLNFTQKHISGIEKNPSPDWNVVIKYLDLLGINLKAVDKHG